MSAEVVPIRSGLTPEPPPGYVDESVVKELTDLLERAKSGEITGIAYAVLCPGDTSYYGRSGRITRGVVGAMEILKFTIIESALKE